MSAPNRLPAEIRRELAALKKIAGLLPDVGSAGRFWLRDVMAESALGCCVHAPSAHDQHGCTVDVSKDRLVYERCHCESEDCPAVSS